MVLALADSAVSDGFGIVHSMVDGLYGAQISEDRLQIVISRLSEKPPRHDRANLPCSDLPRMHGLQELGFVVVADAGWIRRQIRTGHLEIRSCNQISACEFKSGERLTIRVSKCMAPLAGTKLNQIRASLYRRG